MPDARAKTPLGLPDGRSPSRTRGPLMRQRLLGSTGLVVSELCLGAMTFGRETAESESHAILDRFVEAGGNFVDTADIYSAGASEEIVGRWLKQQRREDIVLATKVRYATGDG